MRRIHYAGHSFVTGDSIAEAVMSYATALAYSSRTDLVSLPTRAVGGGETRVAMLIGQALPVACEDLAINGDDGGDELVDSELVAHLMIWIDRLQNPAAIQPDTAPSLEEAWEL